MYTGLLGYLLVKVMETIQPNSVMCYRVLRDFILPGIGWGRMYSDGAGERVVLDVFQNKFWTLHVDFPTHNGGNILDLALSSSAELVHGVSEVGKLGDMDHTLFQLEIVKTNHRKGQYGACTRLVQG